MAEDSLINNQKYLLAQIIACAISGFQLYWASYDHFQVWTGWGRFLFVFIGAIVSFLLVIDGLRRITIYTKQSQEDSK